MIAATCRRCFGAFVPSEVQERKHDFICKPCRQQHDRAYREMRKAAGLPVSGKNLGREYHKAYYAGYSARPDIRARRALSAKARREDPVERVKIAARVAVRRALGRGDLIPTACSVCGSLTVEAHHDDYAKPLDVRWLCREHHREHHAKARGAQ